MPLYKLLSNCILLLLYAVAFSNASSDNLNECPENWKDEQLLPHAVCSKFYQCTHGKLVTHSCPPGLFFSIEANRCEWKANVNCDDRKTSEDDNGGAGGNDDPSLSPFLCAKKGSNGVLVAHERCNKYYICDNGKPEAHDCPNTLLFNPKTDKCDWPRNVDCGNRTISSEDENSSSGSSSSDSSSSDSSSADSSSEESSLGNNSSEEDGITENGGGNSNTGAGNSDPSQAPLICAKNDSNGVLVAHEICKKYSICDNGKPITRPCPSGLLFDPKADKCDWPQNVDCGNRTISSEDDGSSSRDSSSNDSNSADSSSEEDASGDTGDGNNNGGAGNGDPTQAPVICANNGSNGVLVAHEKCDHYYICDNGKPVNRPCPSGLLFDPKTDKCDWPQNVVCGNRTIPSEDDGSSSSNSSSNDSSSEESSIDHNSSEEDESGDNGDGNNNGGAGNCDPKQAPVICANNGSNGVLVAHEKCDHYYICNNGKPVNRPCPSGLLFDPKSDKCDWPQNVVCGNRTIPSEDDGSSSSDSSSSNSSSNDSSSEENGSGDNGDANNNGGNCDPSQAPVICANNGSNGVLVAHEKCYNYYICDNGKPVARPCPGILLFNPKTDKCDWPQNVDCGNRTTSDDEDDNSINDSTSTDSGSEENGSWENIDNGSCDPSQAPAICAKPGSHGDFVAHEKCNRFYICLDGKAVAFDCSKDHFFNCKSHQCDLLRNVDCKNRTIPEQS